MLNELYLSTIFDPCHSLEYFNNDLAASSIARIRIDASSNTSGGISSAKFKRASSDVLLCSREAERDF